MFTAIMYLEKEEKAEIGYSSSYYPVCGGIFKNISKASEFMSNKRKKLVEHDFIEDGNSYMKQIGDTCYTFHLTLAEGLININF